MLRNTIVVLCLALTAAGIYNVYGPAAEVERRAAATACPASRCALRAVERTPIGHTFRYQSRTRVIDVTCRRGAIFLGDYQCAISSQSSVE